MCTVTFIPTGKSEFVLTSNRDEAPNRKTLAPTVYQVDNSKLLFPKDEIAGGTWIGLSNKNRLICLLNGGFTIHERKAEYRMSRGIVVKDILTCDDVDLSLLKYNLEDIEPFTLITVDWSSDLKLYELVWDGIKKHLRTLPIKPKLWSSSTLFNEEMKEQRQEWFKEYLAENAISKSSIYKFHTSAGKDNLDYGIIIDRGFVKTTSITQVEKLGSNLTMQFEDLQKDEVSFQNFSMSEAIND